MAAIEHGAITEWPQSLVWAVFDTTHGAANALAALQRADRNWLVQIEEAAVVVKNKEGGVEINEPGDRGGMSGLGAGALIGGIVGLIFPPAGLAAAAAGGAAGGLGAQIRDAGFEDNALRAAANELSPGQSLLIAVIWHQWVDDAVRFLEQAAYRVGWAEISEQVAGLLQERRQTV
jgi:uncharacterized membrane protein